MESRTWMVWGQVATSYSSSASGDCEPRPPKPGDVRPPRPLDEHGRGLVLVEALADRWEVVERDGSPGKTVRAEVDLYS